MHAINKKNIMSRTVTSLVRASSMALPPSNRNNLAYTAHATSDTASAASHFPGDSNYQITHPNAICVTSSATAPLEQLCTLAYAQVNNPTTPCGWKGKYFVPINDPNIPASGIKTCDSTADPSAVCVPTGTVPVACGSSNSFDNLQAVPGWIAVPKSEATLIADQYSTCYGGQPPSSQDKYAYVRTTNYAAAYSNPDQTLGPQ